MLSPTATLVVLSFVCIGFVCHADIAKFMVSVIDDITGEPRKDVEVTAGFGVLAVTPGRSLEEAYLGK